MADPYSILGVARSANEKDIKSAYRTLAKELHPDRNAGKPNAAERFAEVTNAYDLLSDKDKIRRSYVLHVSAAAAARISLSARTNLHSR